MTRQGARYFCLFSVRTCPVDWSKMLPCVLNEKDTPVSYGSATVLNTVPQNATPSFRRRTLLRVELNCAAELEPTVPDSLYTVLYRRPAQCALFNC